MLTVSTFAIFLLLYYFFSFSYLNFFPFFFILLLLNEESTELLQPPGPEALNHPRILKLFDVTGTRETLPLVVGRCSPPCWTTAAGGGGGLGRSRQVVSTGQAWCAATRGRRPRGLKPGLLLSEQLGRLTVASAACPPSSAGRAPPCLLPSGVFCSVTDKTTLSLLLLMLC